VKAGARELLLAHAPISAHQGEQERSIVGLEDEALDHDLQGQAERLRGVLCTLRLVMVAQYLISDTTLVEVFDPACGHAITRCNPALSKHEKASCTTSHAEHAEPRSLQPPIQIRTRTHAVQLR